MAYTAYNMALSAFNIRVHVPLGLFQEAVVKGFTFSAHEACNQKFQGMLVRIFSTFWGQNRRYVFLKKFSIGFLR